MKRALLFFILLLAFTWPLAAGQSNTQSLTFDDLGLGGGTASSGTYNSNDTFSFDVLLTFNGYNASSLSFWLQTDTAFAGSLSITGVTYGTTFPIHGIPTLPIFFNSGGGENFDLGSSVDDLAHTVPAGTCFVTHITFAISGALAGTYDLASTVTSPRASEVLGFDGSGFSDNPLPAEHYSVTIVPEPATVGLLGLGAAGLAVGLLRVRNRAGRFRATVGDRRYK